MATSNVIVAPSGSRMFVARDFAEARQLGRELVDAWLQRGKR